MDDLIELLKALAPIAGVALAAGKMLFPEGDGRESRKFEERRDRIKEFLSAYDERAHPFVIEASFAAAIGHSKISAIELPILLRQRKPTEFIAVYANVQDYLASNAEGTQLQLRSLASNKWVRRPLVIMGVLLYLFMAGAACFFGLYVLPDAFATRSWSKGFSSMFYPTVFAATAWYILAGSSRLQWAAKLHRDQVREPI